MFAQSSVCACVLVCSLALGFMVPMFMYEARARALSVA